MTKRKKISLSIFIAFVAFCFCMCTMTKGGALRSAVFFTSPYSAFCMEYEKLKTIDKKTTCYIITNNVSIEYGIGELDTWRVESIGPFYFASFSAETW